MHSPRAAGQLGLAEQALGRWEDAERHVGEALRAGDDPWVARNRAALDQSLATIPQHLGRVEITGDPEGAEVSVYASAMVLVQWKRSRAFMTLRDHPDPSQTRQTVAWEVAANG